MRHPPRLTPGQARPILGTMLRDTAPEMEVRYQRSLGQLSPAERLEVAVQLSSGVRALAEAGLRHRHPDASEEELRCRLVVLLYGRDLAVRLFQSVPEDAR
jgi:hypothetical protein